MIQWLGLPASTAGGWGAIPGWGTKIPHATQYGKKKKKVIRVADTERLLLNQERLPGFLASGGEEFNLGPVMRLDRLELLCNKALLKYKR